MASEKSNAVENTASVANNANATKLVVTRESYKGKDGKDYWNYVLRGKIRGRDKKVDFKAKDFGGYEVLDIVFEIASTAELIMREEEMTDSNGKISKYTVYELQNVDENGLVYSGQVKMAQGSDKSLLTMILNEINFKKAK